MHASAPSHSDACCQSSLSAEVFPSQCQHSQSRDSVSDPSQLTCLGVLEHCSPKRSISDSPPLNCNTDDGAGESSVRFYEMETSVDMSDSLTAEAASLQRSQGLLHPQHAEPVSG
jgi:hypothetical protein